MTEKWIFSLTHTLVVVSRSLALALALAPFLSSKLEERQKGMTEQWESERGAVNIVQVIKEKVDKCRVEIDKAEGAYDLTLAGIY